MQLGVRRLWFRCLTIMSYPDAFFGKYICLNFNINVLQKNVFCRFISDQDKNITSFVPWNRQGNIFLYISGKKTLFKKSRSLFDISLSNSLWNLACALARNERAYDVPKPSAQDKKYPELHIHVSLICAIKADTDRARFDSATRIFALTLILFYFSPIFRRTSAI